MTQITVPNPKRKKSDCAWDALYPYYAGYPETFAQGILEQYDLSKSSLIWDPWNGSGTTTAVASKLGIRSVGFDLNPVMVLVARARMVSPLEWSSIRAIGSKIYRNHRKLCWVDECDPLLDWFAPKTAEEIRSIEREIERNLVDKGEIWSVSDISPMASSFYVSLFSAVRKISYTAKPSNPTWWKRRYSEIDKIEAQPGEVSSLFQSAYEALADSLSQREEGACAHRQLHSYVGIGDACETGLGGQKADLVLTSPPYCTRIDYTVATAPEAAVCSPLVSRNDRELRQKIMGTTTVPKEKPKVMEAWGEKCTDFLSSVESHGSWSSSGYYLKSHLDYYQKLYRALSNISESMAPSATFVCVAQDSYYKEVHNDLPAIIVEMASGLGLRLIQEDAFPVRKHFAQINKRSRAYRKKATATEKVLVLKN